MNIYFNFRQLFEISVVFLYHYYFCISHHKMSWLTDEWKDGLPSRALQKIAQIEAQLEKLKKEREQKQFQFESLEQVHYLLWPGKNSTFNLMPEHHYYSWVAHCGHLILKFSCQWLYFWCRYLRTIMLVNILKNHVLTIYMLLSLSFVFILFSFKIIMEYHHETNHWNNK